MNKDDLKIADVYIDGALTGGLRLLHDGSTIDFRGGHAAVYSQDVLLTLLRRPDMEIHPTHRYKDSYPEWLAESPYNHPAQARIVCPDGFTLSPENDYQRPAEPAWRAAASQGAEATWWSDVEKAPGYEMFNKDNPFVEEGENEGPEPAPAKPGRPKRVSDV